MAEYRLDGAVVKVNGSPLAPELYPRLRLARVEESVQLPDLFTLRFEDAHFELFDAGTFVLGTPVEIAFRADGAPIVVTEGEVTAVAVEPGPSSRHELVVSGLDRAHRLARQTRSRTFLGMSDAAIARQIAGEYGLDADVASTPASHEYVLQAGQTDFAFLRDRAARIGFELWVTGDTMCFRPRPKGEGTPPALRWGANLLTFRARFSAAERCDEVIVNGWDDVNKKAITGRATSDQADPGTDAEAAERHGAGAQRAFGSLTRQTGLVGVGSQEEADALATSLLLRASGAEATLHAEVAGDPRLGAGVTVSVERVGETLAGNYRLSAVEHLYGSRQPYVTRVVCGSKDPSGLVDLVRADGTAPFSAGGRGAAHGGSLVPGEVTNNDDPDGLGRVKVRLPTVAPDDETTWARLAVPGGGAARGVQWLPEVGDEVLVGFEQGDVHRPVVLGGMWSRPDQPPESKAMQGGKTEQRVLATRKDHRLEFTDGPESEVRLGMGDAGSELVLTKATTTLAGDQKVAVTGQQIEVTATQKIVLSAPQIEISADSALTLRGKPIKLN